MRLIWLTLLLMIMVWGCAGNRQSTDEQIEAMLASSASYYAKRASSYADSSQYEQAVHNYLKAIDILPYEPAYYNNLGVAYYHLDKLDSALAAYQTALRLRPKYGQVLINVANIYLKKKNYNYAAAAADAAIESEPGMAAAYAVRAAIFTELKLFDSAIEYYQRALKTAPNDPSYRTNLGVLYYRKGLTNEAIRQFEGAIAIDSTLSAAYFNLGNAYARRCLLDEAILQYQLALRYDPKLIGAYNNMGLVLMGQARYAEAVQNLMDALDLQDKNLSAIHFNLSIAYEHLDSIEAARVQIEKALELEPDGALFLVQKGNIYLRLQERAAAINAFDRAIELDSSLVVGFNNLGNAWLPLEAERAEMAYEKAMQIFPEYLEKRYFIANQYLEEGLTDLLGACQSPRQVLSHYAKIYANLGKTYLQVGKLEKARERLEQALQIDPALIDSWQTLAVVYQRQGSPQAARQAMAEKHYQTARAAAAQQQYAVAVAECQDAVDYRPDHAAAYALLGDLWIRMGKQQDGDAAFARAFRLAPDDSQVLIHKANALLGQQRWQEAQSLFVQALERQPDSREALEKLVGLLQRQGDDQATAPYRARLNYLQGQDMQFAGLWDQAYEAFRTAAELAPNVADYLAAQGYLLAQKHLNVEAVQVLQAALVLDPRNSTALYGLGVVYGDQKEFDLAVEALKKAIAAKTDFSKAYYALAVNYYFKKEYELAWQNIEKAESLGEVIRSDFIKALDAARRP